MINCISAFTNCIPNDSTRVVYTKDGEGNVLDPITYNIIPKDRLVFVLEGKHVWYFDIDTLYRSSISEKKIPLNPYTNKPLPEKTLEKIQAYKEKTEVKVKIFSSGIENLETTTYSFPYFKELADALVEIVSTSAFHTKGSDFKTFLSRELLVKKSGLSLYTYGDETQMSVIGNSEWYFGMFPDLNRMKMCMFSLCVYSIKKRTELYDKYHLISMACLEMAKRGYV